MKTARGSDPPTGGGRCFVIVGGGDLTPAFLKERLEAYPDAFVVAADRGMEALNAVGRAPDHILGDFDSVSEAVLRAAKVKNSKEPYIDEFPAEKDFTDTEAAIYYALDHGAERIVMLGMTGGRLDHFIANVHNMLLALKADVPCVMEDPLNRIELMGAGGRRRLLKKETFGTYVSILPLTASLKGLTMRGFKYPLEEADVRKGISLCVSNEITEDEAEISLREGIGAVIFSKDRA